MAQHRGGSKEVAGSPGPITSPQYATSKCMTSQSATLRYIKFQDGECCARRPAIPSCAPLVAIRASKKKRPRQRHRHSATRSIGFYGGGRQGNRGGKQPHD